MTARPLPRLLVLLGSVVLVACSAEAVSKEPVADAGDPDLPHYRILESTETDASLSISPDGRMIAMTRWETGNLAVRDLETGEEYEMPFNAVPFEHGYAYHSAWHPDGDRIAFGWENSEGLWEIRTAAVDGREARTLHRAPETTYAEPLDWTADGRTLVALRTRPDRSTQIVLVDAADGAVTGLRSMQWQWPGAVALSPDGKWLGLELSAQQEPFDPDVRVLALDGSGEHVVFATEAPDEFLGWAPDGSGILVRTEQDGSPRILHVPVRDGRATGEPRVILNGAWNVDPVGFAEDGRFFYTVRTGPKEVWEIAVDGETRRVSGAPRRVSRSELGLTTVADYSPDGRHLLLLRRTENAAPGVASELLVRSVDTGETRVVETRPRLLYSGTVRWLPGTRSAVVRGRTGQGTATPVNFYRVDLQSGAATPLTDVRSPEVIMGYSLAVDESTIYFQTEEPRRDGDTYRIRAQDLSEEPGQGRLVWTVEGGEPEGRAYDGRPRVRNFDLSPDGHTLALRMAEMNADGSGPRTSPILLLPTEGGPPTRRIEVDGAEGSVLWHPSGEEIWATTEIPGADMGDSRLSRIDLRDGSIGEVGLERPGLGAGAQMWGSIRFSPEGQGLAFSAGRQVNELWVLEEASGPRTAAATRDR